MEQNTIILNDLIEISNSNIQWKKLENKTVLISGASGFLASYIVKTLLYLNEKSNLNIKVIGVVRNIEKANFVFKDFLNCDNFSLIHKDVTEFTTLDSKLDYIIHSASQASPKYYGIDPVGTINSNVIGTINLLKLANEKKTESFLYFSSGEVYGIVDESKIPIKENDYGYINPIDVRSCYAESKRMGENLCISWAHQYGLNIKIVRPFHTYGPAMTLDDGRVFSDFVNDIIYKKNIVLNSDGKARRAYCYQTDATIAFIKILLKGKNGEPYNMGNPNEEYSVYELAKILCDIKPEYNLNVEFNQKYIESNTYLKSPIHRNSPNIDKIKELDWYPKVGVFEGFTRVINSFLEH